MSYSRSEAKEYAQEHFRGIFAACLTPFKEDGSPDEDGLRLNIRHWVDDLKIAGLFVNGKQGEYFSMSLEERKARYQKMIATVRDDNVQHWTANFLRDLS